jgi:hypothetical protein
MTAVIAVLDDVVGVAQAESDHAVRQPDLTGFAPATELAERAERVAAMSLVGVDGDGIRDLLAVVRRVEGLLVGFVARLAVRADELAAEGRSAPAAEVLAGDGRVAARTARREAARGKLAVRCPEIAAVIFDGSVGVDHLDVLVSATRRLNDGHVARLDMAGLVGDAQRLPADTFRARVKRAVVGVVGEVEDKRAESTLRHWFDDDTGMGHVHAELDPERYEAVTNALEAEINALAAATGSEKGPRLAADALVELITGGRGSGVGLPHVTVVVDHHTMTGGWHQASTCRTGDGRDLTPDALTRLCCDAVLQRVTLDEYGVPISVGRRYRTATDAQWTALRAVHDSCGWPGCTRPLSHCQAHHILPWNRGGRTDLHNLIPLCSQHHHLVHEGQWQIQLTPNRSVRITRPDRQAHHPPAGVR